MSKTKAEEIAALIETALEADANAAEARHAETRAKNVAVQTDKIAREAWDAVGAALDNMRSNSRLDMTHFGAALKAMKKDRSVPANGTEGGS